MSTTFSDADKRQVLGLVPVMAGKISPSEERYLESLEQGQGLESEAYLQEVTRLYKKHILEIFERPDAKRGQKGHGRGKPDGNSTRGHK